MRHCLLHLIAVIAILALAEPSNAQGTKADYRRSAELSGMMRGKVDRERVEPHWFDDNRRFWYRIHTDTSRFEFVVVDVEKGTRNPAFDHQRVAEALRKAGVANVCAEQLPIDAIVFDQSGKYVDVQVGSNWWRCDLDKYEAIKHPGGPPKDIQIANSQLQPFVGGPKKSNGTGPDVTVTFLNHSGVSVRLYWLNEDGERVPYGSIAVDREHEQPTHVGHLWLVEDARERPLGLFMTAAGATTVEITRTALGRRTGRSRPPRRQGGSRSPDGQWDAFIKENNVWLRGPKNEEFALSIDGTNAMPYGNRFFWSPDGKRLVAVQTKVVKEREVTFIESSPKDQLQPKTHSIPYAKPGDPLPIDRPRMFDVAARKQIPVSNALFENPWSIEDYRWSADSSRFTFVFNQRGHQALRLLAIDAASGDVKPIIDEQSKTFIDYSGKYYVEYLDRTDELIWMSERDGWNHLYLYDAKTGKVKRQITHGPWVVRKVDRVDFDRREVWFQAGGVYPAQDPYYVHYCRANLDTDEMTILTAGDGTHRVEYSPDGKCFLDIWSRVDQAPVTELRRTSDGKLICELERADVRRLKAAGWESPERFVAKGRDGKTDIYGVIFRPTRFDPAKKYPIVEDIYAGPQDSFVPKAFAPYYRQQAMAELGFIVVQIDGMGTSNRSKKFHDVCWKNLADAGLPDRMLWIKAAAAKYAYMDLSRRGHLWRFSRRSERGSGGHDAR